MWLVIIFGALIVVARLFSNTIGELEVFGLTFTLGVIITAFLLPLRDAIQEHAGRRYVIGTIIASGLFVYFFFPPLEQAPELQEVAAAGFTAALIWMEIVDFAVYTFFRRWGWLPGVVLSDIIAAPLLAIFFFQFIYRAVEERGYLGLLGNSSRLELISNYFTNDDIIVKYSVLLVVYIILVVSKLPTRLSGYPMWRRVPWERGE